MRELVRGEAQQFAGRRRDAQTREICAVEALGVDGIGEAQIDLVAEHHRGDELASARPRVLGSGEDGHHHVAWMTAAAPGRVIHVVHLHVAGRGAVDEGRHVRCRPDRGADHGRATRIGNPGRDPSDDAARHSVKAADQGAEGVDHTHLRGVDHLGRKVVGAQATRVLHETLLDAVHGLHPVTTTSSPSTVNA